jgi:hypothetical protein
VGINGYKCLLQITDILPERVFTELLFPDTCFSEHLVFSPEKLGFLRSHQGYSQRFGRKPSFSSSRIFFTWFLSGFRKTSKRLVFFRLFMFAIADEMKIFVSERKECSLICVI